MQAEDDVAYIRIKQAGWNLSIMKEMGWTNFRMFKDLPHIYPVSCDEGHKTCQDDYFVDCMVPDPWYWRLIKK